MFSFASRVRALLSTLLLTVGFFFAGPLLDNAHAASCTSAGSGNWNAITWTGCASGPQPADTVTIASGNNVTVNVSSTVSSLTMASPTAANSLIIATGKALTITNALTFTANAAANGQTIVMQGTGNLTAGSIATSASTGVGVSSITCASGATGTLNVSGNIALVGSGVTSSNGTKIDFGTVATACNLTAGSVTLTGGSVSGGVLKMGTGTLTLNGALTGAGTAAKAQFTTNASAAIILNGGTIGTGATLTIGAGTDVTTTGTSSITYATGVATWGDITVSNGTFTYSVVASTFTSITIDNAATFAAGAISITTSGNYTNNGTHSGTKGLVMTGANAILDGSGSYTNTGALTLVTAAKSFAATANLTFAGPIAIAGAITVTNNGTVTVTSATGITGTAGGSAWVNAASSTLNNAGPMLATGTLTATASNNTIDYDGAVQTLKGATYFNLTIDGTGAKTMTGITTVNGDFNADGGTATDPLTTIGGDFTVDGGSPTLSAALIVSGNLTVNSGTLTTGAVALTIDGTAEVSGGILTMPAGAGNKTFEGLMTVDGGTLSGASAVVVFQGGITQTSGSVALTGTALFNGLSQSLNGTYSIATSTVATGITVTNNGALTASGVITITGSFINNGTVSANSTLTGVGSWTQGANSILTAAGATTNAMAVATVDFATNINTVTYSGAAQTLKATTYSYLSLAGSAAKTMTGVTTINNDLTLSGTATALTAANLAIGGNLTILAGTLTTGNFTLSVGEETTVNGTFTHSGSATVTLSGDLFVNGTLSGAGTGMIIVNGDVTGPGIISLSGNMLEQRVNSNQNFGQVSGSNNWSFKELTFSNSGTTPAMITTESGGNGGITVNTLFMIGRSTDASGATTTLDPADVTWTLLGTGAVFTLAPALGILCDPGTCSDNISTFSYTGNGATTIAGSTGYYNLLSTPTLTGAAAYSAGGPIGVANNFTINPSAASNNRLLTLTLNGNLTVGNTLTVDGSTSACSAVNTSGTSYAITAGAITISAGIGTCTDNLIANSSNITLTGTGTPFTVGETLATFTRNTSTVTYTGDGATITMLSGAGATNTYSNLALMPSGPDAQVIGSGGLEVNGNLMIGDGTNTGAATSGNPALTVHNDVTIAANAAFTVASGSLTLSGDWSNAGSFAGTGSTIAFKGAAAQQVDNQGQTFGVLIDSNTSNAGVTFASGFTASALYVNGAGLASATTVYLDAGSIYTITDLTLIGSSGKTVRLRSDTPTQVWFLNNTSTNTIAFVDVQDSSAAAGVPIVGGASSIDTGDNTNWTFALLSVTLSTHNYDFGTVNMGATTVSVTGITVTNGGNGTETYSLSVATTGAQTLWGVKTSTPTAQDKFVLLGLFNSVQPSSTTFLISDVVFSTPMASSASVYAGNQTGLSAPAASTRLLWLRLNMPLTTSTTDQQLMDLTVTATSP